jgi:epoxyqueuosine reductase
VGLKFIKGEITVETMNNNKVTKEYIRNLASSFFENSKDNYIAKEIAIAPDMEETKIFEAPILAFGDADDEYFKLLKDPDAIGSHFVAPKDWLPEAKTVISFFLPYTEEIRKSNRIDMSWPSNGWLYGRIEGQELANKFCHYLISQLGEAGYKSIAPTLSERFWAQKDLDSENPNNGATSPPSFTSNWSERHVAFVCGLGTFSLSKGLITEKGMAGRLGSIVTELDLSPDERNYQHIYEYCSMCGACIKNCPVNAISMEKGKIHKLCSDFIDLTAERCAPRYGCGKCQVKVPCESSIPKKGG